MSLCIFSFFIKADTASVMKLDLLIFQNRLRFQLLLAKITDNDFLGERLRQRRFEAVCDIATV